MINRLQLIWITLRRSLLLFFIPIICMYGIIPIVAIVSPRNEGLQNTIMASRILLPPSALLWYMAYLQMWIESEGQEAMRACSKGKHTCAPELMLLAASFMLSKGTTFHTVRRKQKAGKHNMRCSFPLFFCPRIYILYFFVFEMHTPNL